MSNKAPITLTLTADIGDLMRLFFGAENSVGLEDMEDEAVVLLFKPRDDDYCVEEIGLDDPASPYYEQIDGEAYPISDTRALEHVLAQAWFLDSLTTLSSWFYIGIDKKTSCGKYTLKSMSG